MASNNYTVGEADEGVYEKTLNTGPDTVTFPRDCDWVEVIHLSGTGGLKFTVDGSTPTFPTGPGFYVPAGGALKLEAPTPGNTVVKLVSGGAVTYGVTGARW